MREKSSLQRRERRGRDEPRTTRRRQRKRARGSSCAAQKLTPAPETIHDQPFPRHWHSRRIVKTHAMVSSRPKQKKPGRKAGLFSRSIYCTVMFAVFDFT
jgi:hypothetical protein